jgi:hypothetical protein
MDDITRQDVVKVIILTVPATILGIGFFGLMGFMLYMIWGVVQ